MKVLLILVATVASNVVANPLQDKETVSPRVLDEIRAIDTMATNHSGVEVRKFVREIRPKKALALEEGSAANGKSNGSERGGGDLRSLLLKVKGLAHKAVTIADKNSLAPDALETRFFLAVKDDLLDEILLSEPKEAAYEETVVINKETGLPEKRDAVTEYAKNADILFNFEGSTITSLRGVIELYIHECLHHIESDFQQDHQFLDSTASTILDAAILDSDFSNLLVSEGGVIQVGALSGGEYYAPPHELARRIRARNGAKPWKITEEHKELLKRKSAAGIPLTLEECFLMSNLYFKYLAAAAGLHGYELDRIPDWDADLDTKSVVGELYNEYKNIVHSGPSNRSQAIFAKMYALANVFKHGQRIFDNWVSTNYGYSFGIAVGFEVRPRSKSLLVRNSNEQTKVESFYELAIHLYENQRIAQPFERYPKTQECFSGAALLGEKDLKNPADVDRFFRQIQRCIGKLFPLDSHLRKSSYLQSALFYRAFLHLSDEDKSTLQSRVTNLTIEQDGSGFTQDPNLYIDQEGEESFELEIEFDYKDASSGLPELVSMDEIYRAFNQIIHLQVE